MNLWLIVLGMGIITYAIRLSFIVMGERVQVAAVFRRGLKYVPTAVLSAIILPEILQPGGTLDVSWGNGRLLAGLIAALVAWRTQNVLWTIAVGMVVLWLL
jgi:branched-subunit amino acid transport protein